MPLEITVGSPQLVVHHGQTVFASDPDGQIPGASQHGLFFRDTRLISYWRLYANGDGWDLLNSGDMTHFAARVFLTNRAFAGEYGEVPARSLSLVLGRWTSGGLHEDLDLTNHSMQTVRFNLEVSIRSDFGDLFDVKTKRQVRRGRINSEWSELSQTLRNTYTNGAFQRGIETAVRSETEAFYGNGRISFDITLHPGGTWHACLLTDITDGAERIACPGDCIDDAGGSAAAQSVAAWRRATTKLEARGGPYERQCAQAIDDLAALRLPIDGGMLPAAGLPWFLAPFGRDSLIVALQTMPMTDEFALGALKVLGDRQAREIDDYRDAEPGKILHEQRNGELAFFKLIPHTPYYGTADATPLYLVVLHATWKWTGDETLLATYLDVAERCLAWIDDYGDRDGDGFQEYQTRAAAGYENVGWKDSGDGVLYPDGSLVRGPKALCELQGYVYAAWTGMAEIYAHLGRATDAARLRAKAATLYNRFNDAFWDEELGFYLYALDGAKQPVRTVVSNVGHCLWTGIVRPDRARRVVERLLAPDMFSGWGIRTLSSHHPAFNPYSYHNGSVWPHDNGLIAQGFRRYGFAAEAARVARAVCDAAEFFALHQVPELYAGITRNHTDFPVQCLGANVPQAWAAGSAFSFLQAMLGMHADAPNGVLRLDPKLPDWLPEIILRDLKFAGKTMDLRISHDEGDNRVEVLRGPASMVMA
jgi:glycogen debranching enzyme